MVCFSTTSNYGTNLNLIIEVMQGVRFWRVGFSDLFTVFSVSQSINVQSWAEIIYPKWSLTVDFFNWDQMK